MAAHEVAWKKSVDDQNQKLPTYTQNHLTGILVTVLFPLSAFQ